MPASAVAVFITWVPGILRSDDRRHPAPFASADSRDQHLSQLDALCWFTSVQKMEAEHVEPAGKQAV
jgi:hypothetical protein